MAPKQIALADLEELWAEIDRFYDSFTPADWARQHGRDWTFADLPFHLAYFNDMVVEGLKADADSQAFVRRGELVEWNDAHFREAPKQTGRSGLDAHIASRDAIRELGKLPPETPVFIPIIVIGGWRRLDFALEYLAHHTWMHFAETTLRYENELPDVREAIANRAMNFLMESAAGGLLPEMLDGIDLRIVMRLTGEGGAPWLFTITNNVAYVKADNVEDNDGEYIASVKHYLKTSYFRIMNPLPLMLIRKIRVKKPWNVTKFQKLFSPSRSRPWKFAERGRVAPPG